jgi:hypothetical protein
MTLRVSLLALLCLFAGCLTTRYTLVKPEEAKVDLAFVGDWNVEGGNPQVIHVRNLDGHQYLVEWKEKEKMERWVGFTTAVKDATFAQLRKLADDGNNDTEYVVLRVEIKSDKLTLHHLKESFFNDKTINSSDDLRKVLADNLANPEMDEETQTATRLAIPGDGVK